MITSNSILSTYPYAHYIYIYICVCACVCVCVCVCVRVCEWERAFPVNMVTKTGSTCGWYQHWLHTFVSSLWESAAKCQCQCFWSNVCQLWSVSDCILIRLAIPIRPREKRGDKPASIYIRKFWYPPPLAATAVKLDVQRI